MRKTMRPLLGAIFVGWYGLEDVDNGGRCKVCKYGTELKTTQAGPWDELIVPRWLSQVTYRPLIYTSLKRE
jgi:hypothetical protein